MAEIHDRLRDWWNADAETYDRAPSHAASDPVEAAAWRAALGDALPAARAAVLDVGAGTGAMSLLAAELGHDVTALDLSPAMLDQARSKAAARDIRMSFVVGRADEPPAGPFDAVMERHVIWTAPHPVETLGAWRAVVRPGGRLVLFEGVWGRTDALGRAREAAAEALRRVYGVPHDHHDDYDPAIVSQLPLAGLSSAAPLVDAVYAAGWRGVRLRRLRDVEWARRTAARPLLGALESTAQYALTAES
jgi:SAM-dependent methyltransferase